MQTEKVLDRRTLRTKQAITDAFTALIIEKDFENITVTELAERANINRKTFYSHYNCIEDVLEELQEALGGRIVEIYNQQNTKVFDVVTFANTMNRIMDENYCLYRRLVVANSYRFFSRNIKDSLKTAFISQISGYDKLSKEELDLVAEYCITGVFKMYKVWFEGDLKISKEELSLLVGKVVGGSIKGVYEK